MSNTGYPTPDNFEGDADYVCIPLIVPNKPEFKAAIYGLYGQMTNSWFWREMGTMSPDDAAWLSSLALGQTEAYGECGDTMSCEDIADCIETSEAVQQAVINNVAIQTANIAAIANSGIDFPEIDAASTTIQSSTHGIGTSGKNEEVKELPNCDLDKLWSGLRDGIVQRLDDNARSVLQWLVTKADIAERAQSAIGAIPVFGSIANALLTQVVQAAPDMLNLFEAYSSIEHMDEIACELFAIGCSECRYPTFDEIYQYYASLGVTGLSDIDDLVIAAATEYLLAGTELASLAFYHTLISFQCYVLFLGSKFYGHSGYEAFLRMASLGEDFANDNWQTLCEACDEPYEIYEWDFTTQGQGDWYVDTAAVTVSNKPVFVNGKGWLLVPHGTGRRADIARIWDTSYELRGCAYGTKADAPNAVTGRNFITRPNQGTNTGATAHGASTPAYPWNNCTTGLASITNIREVAIFVQAGATGMVYIERVRFSFNKNKGLTPTIPTNDLDICL